MTKIDQVTKLQTFVLDASLCARGWKIRMYRGARRWTTGLYRLRSSKNIDDLITVRGGARDDSADYDKSILTK